MSNAFVDLSDDGSGYPYMKPNGGIVMTPALAYPPKRFGANG